jgi:hypothetical protein
MNGGESERFYDKLDIGSLTCALRDLNSALDSGTANGITFQEVCDYLEKGNLIEHLQERLGLSFSTVRPEVEQNKFLIEGLRFVRDRAGGQELRRFGVQNSGVCLLIAYVTELIQNGHWDKSSLMRY